VEKLTAENGGKLYRDVKIKTAEGWPVAQFDYVIVTKDGKVIISEVKSNPEMAKSGFEEWRADKIRQLKATSPENMVVNHGLDSKLFKSVSDKSFISIGPKNGIGYDRTNRRKRRRNKPNMGGG